MPPEATKYLIHLRSYKPLAKEETKIFKIIIASWLFSSPLSLSSQNRKQQEEDFKKVQQTKKDLKRFTLLQSCDGDQKNQNSVNASLSQNLLRLSFVHFFNWSRRWFFYSSHVDCCNKIWEMFIIISWSIWNFELVSSTVSKNYILIAFNLVHDLWFNFLEVFVTFDSFWFPFNHNLQQVSWLH